MNRGRAYLRVLPESFGRKAFGVRDEAGALTREPYPAAAVAAFYGILCLADYQPERGRFASLGVVKALLEGPNGEGRAYARQLPYLVAHKDLIVRPGGVVYVDGWDELQEGDLDVPTRMRVYRNRHGTDPGADAVAAPVSGAERTANWRLRTRVFERDQHTCRYCGIDDYPREWLVLEQVIPDGPSTEENLVTACRGCNKRKGGQTPEQAGMTLRDAPAVTSRDASHEKSPTSRDASHAVASHRNDPLSAIESTPYVLLSGEQTSGERRAENGSPSRDPARPPTWFDAETPEGPALAWLAKHGAAVDPNGNGLHVKLTRLVEVRGLPAVLAAFEELAADPDVREARQFVLGADNVLNRIPTATAARHETPTERQLRELTERAEAREAIKEAERLRVREGARAARGATP